MINFISVSSGSTGFSAQDRAGIEPLTARVPQSQTSTPLRSEPRSIPAVLISVSPSEENQGLSSRVEPGAETDASTASNQRGGALARSESQTPDTPRTESPGVLSEAERDLVRQLSDRDREVRQHELAHQSASGGLAGAMSLSYQRGPDGRLYAVGGEVSIQTQPASSDPKDVLAHAEKVLRAAMAPANPSSQDLQVAAQARLMAQEARMELAALSNNELESSAAQTDSETETQIKPAEAAAPEASDASDAENEREQVDYFSKIQESKDKTTSELEAYQDRLAGIQEQLAEVNQKLTELGVLDALYAPGGLIDEQT